MHTLILAGGSGTRLFPLSREYYPKQFLPLFDGKSLFQMTIERALLHSRPEEIFIITNENLRFLASDQAGGICDGCRVLVEPQPRSTLPAIYFGMQEIVKDAGSACVLVLPSDHLVEVDDSYHQSVHSAVEMASGHLMVFGVTPDRPEAGYGYIRTGERASAGYRVDAFVEKPDIQTAEKYVKDGYLWNSGMFMLDSALFFSECSHHAPEVVAAFKNADTQKAFADSPAVSIDYGLMEKTECAGVVPFTSSWNDLGSFEAIYREMPHDGHENAVEGECICIDSSENLVISDRLVMAIGLNEMAVIDTRDALLVCPLSRSQEVGKVVQDLKMEGDERARLHTTVYRPWGSYTELEKDDGYKIKRISVPPLKRLSLQMHHHRSEHWVVVKGTAEVTIEDKTFFVRQGESTFVPSGVQHRLANPGKVPLEMIEVQIGEYIGEDDIVRFDDDYSRI